MLASRYSDEYIGRTPFASVIVSALVSLANTETCVGVGVAIKASIELLQPPRRVAIANTVVTLRNIDGPHPLTPR